MSDTGSTEAPELWGGLECTVARLRNRWRDQLVETGHQRRPQDMDALAALGFRRLRYPVLWERVSPDDPDVADFRWHDPRLARLRELNLDPILGLIHHGSGPRYTSLLDPGFPELLARHAGRVAERYSWVRHFTPVNEPLTTARFSALYGYWYPHRRDLRSFMRAFINQCRGVVLAMKAIREVIPDARLIQTEDLGKTFSTPKLQYQADYENNRRWLAFDLLTGRVDREHPWFSHFLDNGIAESELVGFFEDPCPPDVLGINHYLTSERYLDHEHLPASRRRSGNGRHRYADVEAVRVDLPSGTTGPEARLRETWERYRLPLAVTEVHHGCSRDEQLRWLAEVWDAACKLRREGADVRAVTTWAAFGAKDWNSLLARKAGHYEPGLFDIRSPQPRITALGRAAAQIAQGETIDHPVLDTPGWWHRDDRFYRVARANPSEETGAVRKLLITGSNTMLGDALIRIARHRGLEFVALDHGAMDMADAATAAMTLRRHRPWAVVNAAGFSQISEAERQRSLCFRENATGPAALARACADAGLPLLTFSSDLVFDGALGRPYRESDPVNPSCTYGESKAEGERLVLTAHPGALIIRTGASFGPWDERNTVYRNLRAMADRKILQLSDTVRLSPAYLPDLTHAVLDLLIDGEHGVWHVTNRGETSWYGLIRKAAERARLQPLLLSPELPPRTASSTALTSERGLIMPTLESGLGRFIREVGRRLRTVEPHTEHHVFATT
ncbi:hypothetical protein GCM10007276_02170 [Agaricicola taiwanensis]|uniref:dTDP-4-dehydrorhamnose reductase n=1 Tax=Agaricicola taiwanensis TaxID=591372 RepID=A0A8J2YF66_9RHOB|nr:sugar nucleotide-binding protein [Agaricicola taiwanensis]GGE28583.1 hypothetical protein GCM10007276_02170 [Agaricicola taiwanensis]